MAHRAEPRELQAVSSQARREQSSAPISLLLSSSVMGGTSWGYTPWEQLIFNTLLIMLLKTESQRGRMSPQTSFSVVGVRLEPGSHRASFQVSHFCCLEAIFICKVILNPQPLGHNFWKMSSRRNMFTPPPGHSSPSLQVPTWLGLGAGILPS